MTAERWRQLTEVVSATLELAPEQRTQFITESCNGDASLIAEVRELVAAYDQSAFLDEPALSSRIPDPEAMFEEEADTLLGTRIGPYRLQQSIGRGGMGAVYLVAREDGEFSMQAAIKVVRRGLNSGFLVDRFRVERQILARLSHPNIARLLDGGVTPDGLPYFVMEYVEGTPIDQYCIPAGLSLEARLDLFRAVCAAIHYAHQNLVVHGDISSKNILVTADGLPKLLDFGIARTLDAGPGGSHSVHAMTPDYASPEQLRGEPVTTASDVYSLGVLLYELATGRRPHNFAGRTPATIVEILDQTDVPRPSIETGDRSLRDLDWIVRKAMQRDPVQRYGSVAQLSEDVRRFLAGMAVLAHPESLPYRAVRFALHNKALVTVAGLLFAALIGGIITTTWQARVAGRERSRAERRLEDVRKLASSFIFEVDDTVAALPGGMAVRQALVTKSLEYLDALAKEVGADAALMRDLAAAYERMGDVQGRQGSANLGNTAGAIESYRKALAIREKLMAAKPNEGWVREGLASTYVRLSGALKVAGEYGAGLDLDRKALAMREALLAEEPNNVNYRRAVASSYNSLGGSLSQLGDWDGVLEYRRKSLDIFEQLVRASPQNFEDRRSLALAHRRLAGALLVKKESEPAMNHMQRGLEMEATLAAERPNNVQLKVTLSAGLNAYGRALIEAEDNRTALDVFSKALSILQEVVTADPKDARARSLLAASQNGLGRAMLKMGAPYRALMVLRESMEVRKAVARESPLNAGAVGEVGEAHAAIGDALAALSKRKEALESYRSARDILVQLKIERRTNAPADAELERVTMEMERLSRR